MTDSDLAAALADARAAASRCWVPPRVVAAVELCISRGRIIESLAARVAGQSELLTARAVKEEEHG